jgi:hypothetical protein
MWWEKMAQSRSLHDVVCATFYANPKANCFCLILAELNGKKLWVEEDVNYVIKMHVVE